MAATRKAATFMGKNFSGIQSSIMNSTDLTLKMFDITSKLVVEKTKSTIWIPINGERTHGDICH